MSVWSLRVIWPARWNRRPFPVRLLGCAKKHKLAKEIFMRPMFLSEVEHSNFGGVYSHRINDLRAAGDQVPQIMHLFGNRSSFLGWISD